MRLRGRHFPGICETQGLISRTKELVKKKLNPHTSTLEDRLTKVGTGLGQHRRQVGLGCQSTRFY